MGAIYPTDGTSGSPPASGTTDTGPTTPTPPPTTTSTDSMSSSNILAAPGMFSYSSSATPWLDPPQAFSLIQYANLVGIARINLGIQSRFSNELGFLVTKDVWANAAGTAAAVLEYYNTVRTVQQQQNQLAAAEQAQADAVNPSIDAYNAQNDFTGDQAATNTMNSAITDFNNGAITATQFNDAVAIYNAYATSHNMQPYTTDYDAQAAAYNAQVDINNVTISQINAQNALVNLPPLPLQTHLPLGSMPLQTISPPATVPVTLLPVRPSYIPNATVDVQPSGLNDLLVESGFEDYAENAMKAQQFVNDTIAAAEAFRDYNQFIHKDILNPKNGKVAPTSYVPTERKGAKTGATAESAAVSGGYSQLAAGIDSIALPRTLGLNLYKGAMQEAQVPTSLAGHLSVSLAGLNLAIGQRAGLLSASPGVLSIGDSSLENVPAVGPPINVLVSLGFANVIRGLVNSQQLSGIVGTLLSTNGVSESDLLKLTKSVTAGFQLSLVQQAIVQVANALGLPGSVTQILGNLSGIPNLSSVVASAASPTVSDVIGNRHLSDFLAKNLISQLTSNQPPVDPGVIQGAFSAAAAQNSNSAYAFANSLKNELIARGVDQSTAQTAAAQTNALIDSELDNQYLDTVLTQNQINAGIQDQYIKSDLLSKSSITARDVRDSLLNQYTLQGISFKESLSKSDQAAAIVTGSRLAQEFNAETINQGLLQKSIEDGLANSGGSTISGSSIADSALQGRLGSASQLREAIYSQLVANGIGAASAHAIAGQAAIVRNGADPFHSVGGAGVTSLDAIASKIQSEAYEILKESLGSPTALSVAQQLAAAVVGSPTNQNIVYDDIHRPVSLFNLANQQVSDLIETGHRETLEAVTESFRESMRPNDNLFYIVALQNTPGRELINAMSLMNANSGNGASNYLKSIDIPA